LPRSTAPSGAANSENTHKACHWELLIGRKNRHNSLLCNELQQVPRSNHMASCVPLKQPESPAEEP
jgi:hypothetical protein